MKVTILQGQLKFEPENEAEESALRALAESGRAQVIESKKKRGKLSDVLIEFGGPETPWRRVDEEPPPDGERILLLDTNPYIDHLLDMPSSSFKAFEGRTYRPWVRWDEYKMSRDTTHWCPCPEPFPRFRGAEAEFSDRFTRRLASS